jgi:hypothetical protein
MIRSWEWLPVAVVLMAASGCGSSRQLQSVALSPAAADAKSFPNGQVNFTATGMYNKPPSPVVLGSSDVLWCVGTASGTCAGNVEVGATVDQNGVTQCTSGFSGTATILGGTLKSGTGPVIPDGGSQLKIFGAAQLTCP